MPAKEYAVPELTLAAPDITALEAAIRRCCDARKVEFSDIAEVRENSIILKINHGEGMCLFKDDPLLGKELKLFSVPTEDNHYIPNVHTESNLEKLNQANSAHAITVTRSASLDAEFAEIVRRAEETIKDVTVKEPTVSSFDEVYAHAVAVVGEWHHEQSARLNIASIFSDMKTHKSALVMEGIPRNRQALLDDYFNAPADAPVPALLLLSLEEHAGPEKEGYYSAKRLLEDAKSAGIPVFAFDSDGTLLANYSNRNDEVLDPDKYSRAHLDYRLLTMNQEAVELIQELEARGYEKIVVNVGGAHAMPENGIPGIGDYVGGAQLMINDVPKGELPITEITDAAPEGITRGKHLRITCDPEVLKQALREQEKGEPLQSKFLQEPSPEDLLARCGEINKLLPANNEAGLTPSPGVLPHQKSLESRGKQGLQ